MSETREFEFQIDGVVTIGRLRDALEAWAETFETLQRHIGKDVIIANRVSDLSGGSAAAVSSVEFSSSDAANQFADLYAQVGVASQFHDLSRFPQYIQVPAKKLSKVIPADTEEAADGVVWRSPAAEILLVELPETEHPDEELFSDLVPQSPQSSYGVLSGQLKSLTSHQGLEARIYDSLFNRAVKIRLSEEHREQLRSLWDRQVEARGTINRDPRSGLPLSIVDVDDIYLQEIPVNDSDGWRRAAGVLKSVGAGRKSEDIIKGLWDEADLSGHVRDSIVPPKG